MEQQKNTEKFNIAEYSYTAKSHEEYFTEKFQSRWSFNKQIFTDLTKRKYVKLLPETRQLAFVKFDKSKETPNLTPLALKITPLQFFNLFYHELDFIIANKSTPLSIAPRLQKIKMYFHDKLYLYLKLIELLKYEKDQQLEFIATEIEDQFNRVFLSHLRTSNNAQKSAKETIDVYKSILYTNNSIEERYDMLLQFKHFNHQLHSDAHIDSYIREEWLSKEIEYHRDLINNGIKTMPPQEVEGLQELRNIFTDETTKDNKESNIDKDPQINIPAKFYALYHWILIEMGLEKNFTCNESDKYIRKDIENFVINKYPQTSPQGFYRAYIEIDITNKKAIVNNFGNNYKKHIIKISNNNARIIDHLKRYPN
ncbi:hypothetical protein LX69_01943 [Breznakibacter xylanolyticus]|uniref:Uncharacterized protein n=1 Tax=Breznakibacter xylanolyticus TaxID=990 RepID=A0A2W7N8N9_9BACT|nr:hypothetical protein [Breznakibacter xylanolyticus]PZX16448.1 hypothetical protein LX69_01943 [Breznakibacter xylanolyticus]